ncbi:MAG: hypothetical protein AAGC70_17755 [Pseudomonadota bacterium]
MMGFLKKLFGAGGPEQTKSNRTETTSASVFVSDQPGQGVSLDEAAKLQAAVMENISDAGLPVSQKINAAAHLMTSGAFRECIAAYEDIARQHPEELGECEGQIGAAYFFLGEYETAITYYKQALANGADASMMQDNIEEAEDAIAARGQ